MVLLVDTGGGNGTGTTGNQAGLEFPVGMEIRFGLEPVIEIATALAAFGFPQVAGVGGDFIVTGN